MAMLAVGFDQYLAVMEPLEYSTKVTKSVACRLVTTVWALGAGAAAISAVQVTSSKQSPWSSCRYLIKLVY